MSERENWDNGLNLNQGHRSEVILAFCAKYKVPTRPKTQKAMYEYLSKGNFLPPLFLTNCWQTEYFVFSNGIAVQSHIG